MKKLILISIIAIAQTAHAQLVPQTQLEQDLANISRAANATTWYGQLLVQSLNSAHAAVWNLPDDRLSAVLTHLGPQTVGGLVQLQLATATALNQSLDAAQDSGPRAIVSPSREFTWDGTNAVVVPLPTPTPSPTPAPTPTPEESTEEAIPTPIPEGSTNVVD
jgi:hypothetical protein